MTEEGGKSYRFNMRVEPEWHERVKAEADRLGITVTAFVTMVVNDWLDRNRPATKTKGKNSKKD